MDIRMISSRIGAHIAKLSHLSYKVVRSVITGPFFFLGLGIILALERIFPAKPKQKIFSLGFTQDAVWSIFEAAFEISLVAAYVILLDTLYKQHLDFLTIKAIQSYPVLIRYTIWILAADFMGWFDHWVRHKVPWFWRFHEVHHSQRELNMFTDQRYHALEYIITKTIDVLPLMMLGADVYSIVYFGMVQRWLGRLSHSNIRSNFGFLRHIMVTPQSHRIHHSIEKRHYDKNFGNMLSIWDRLFSTQCLDWEVYPDTGIPNKDFPVEKEYSPLALFLAPIRQHIYPFAAIAKDLTK